MEHQAARVVVDDRGKGALDLFDEIDACIARRPEHDMAEVVQILPQPASHDRRCLGDDVSAEACEVRPNTVSEHDGLRVLEGGCGTCDAERAYSLRAGERHYLIAHVRHVDEKLQSHPPAIDL